MSDCIKIYKANREGGKDMKKAIVVISAIILGIFMLGAACEIPSCKAKWSQGEDVWELGGTTSQYISDAEGKPYDTENADDFECKTGDPVNYVTWYGVHCLDEEIMEPEYLYQDFAYPTYYDYCGCRFIIRFYGDNGEDPPKSLPVGEPLATYEVVPDAIRLTPPDKTGYFYRAKLEPPFEQEANTIYWISIVLNCGDNELGPPPEHHPQWFWQFAEDQWHDYSAQKSEYWYEDTAWHSLYDEHDIRDNMAFWLFVEEPELPEGD
jgi:hypothetical protein